MTKTEEEIRSQPACWRAALALAEQSAGRLASFLEGPLDVIGCGTSYYMALSVADCYGEDRGGDARAYPASEYTPRQGRQLVAITRSGTTTEVLEALRAVQDAGLSSLVVTCVGSSPAAELATETVVLDFADEASVVQTRSATSNLLLLRAAIARHAHDGGLGRLPGRLEQRLAEYRAQDAVGFEHFVYLGSGWAYGVACEAALKMKEASLSITEAYYTMEYRHGPVSLAGPRSLVTVFGGDPRSERVAADVRRTGATVRVFGHEDDPLVGLVGVQLEAVAIAVSKGINPDEPRNLTRSIIL
jgi:fructoselysine-6-P-deglycase FrlB-like protein